MAHTPPTKSDVYVAEIFLRAERILVICNHQTNVRYILYTELLLPRGFFSRTFIPLGSSRRSKIN